MLEHFEEMKDILAKSGYVPRLAVVAAQEEHTLDAVTTATKEGFVEPILIGDVEKIKDMLAELNFDSDRAELIPAGDAIEAAQIAAKMVLADRADIIMKGKTETGTILKVLVNKENGISCGRTMSLLALLESPYYHKVFGMTDPGMLIAPTLEQKADAIRNAVEVLHALGVAEPKVAVIAAVEKVNPKMQATLDADQLKKMNQAGELPGCIVEGPISYDLAMQKEASAVKGYSSPVAGDADLLVLPEIVSGNILGKVITCTGGGNTVGIVLGARVPLVMTSRSASTEDKMMSIILAGIIGSYKRREQV